MARPRYDVFISYRRESAAELAQLIRNALTERGFRVFLDVRELGAGHFDEALLRRIEEATDFVLLLTPGSLERCRSEGDWLRKEISHALETKRNFVPVAIGDFDLRQESELPNDLAAVERHQFAIYDHRFSDESIDRLQAMLTASKGVRRRRRRRAALAAMALAGMVAALAFLTRDTWLGMGKRAGQTVSAMAGARPSVAVLGFGNLGGENESDWVATAASEFLRADLGAGGALRIIPGENVARLRMEMEALAAVESTLAPDTLERVGSLLGSDVVVVGNYLTQRELQLNTSLQRTVDGETVASLSERGPVDELFEIVGRVGSGIRREMGVGEISETMRRGAEATLPTDPVAARLYAEGLARLRQGNAVGARQLLEEAVALEPDHPMAHVALADAWSELGYDGNAREEALLAHEAATSLPEHLQRGIEARLREFEGSWDEAAEIYGGLFVVFPDDLEYGLRLAGAQIAGGDLERAFETISGLRQLPGSQGTDPRIDLRLVEAFKAATDFEAMRETAEAASGAARARGGEILFAEGRAAECDALVNLGMTEEGRPVCKEANVIFETVGHGAGAARVKNIIAVSFAREGEMERARDEFAEALETFRRIGDRRGVFAQLNNLAGVSEALGEVGAARSYYAEAAVIAEEVGDRHRQGIAELNLAVLNWSEGLIEDAIQGYESARTLFEETGARRDLAIAIFNLGEALHARGELEIAEARYAESAALFRDVGGGSDEADALTGQASVASDRGYTGRAKRLLEQAFEIYESMGSLEQAAATEEALDELGQQVADDSNDAQSRGASNSGGS